MPPLCTLVPLAVPPEATVSLPLLTVVAVAAPPEDTISLPPLIVALVAVPNTSWRLAKSVTVRLAVP